MVSIAGGEPLLHPDIDKIVAALVERKVYVYLCTNAVLLRRRLERFTPSHFFSWVVHVDGLGERHDAAVDRVGVFDEVVEAIREAKARGLPGDHELDLLQHRLAEDGPRRPRLPERRPEGRRHDDLARLRLREGARPGALHGRRADPGAVRGGLRREAAQASGGSTTRRCSSTSWRARSTSSCTAWGIPSYSVLGWQRPCYLMADGYASSYQELVETTDWSNYGRGQDPRCANCMAHCGYEPSAVIASLGSLRQSLRALVSTH